MPPDKCTHLVSFKCLPDVGYVLGGKGKGRALCAFDLSLVYIQCDIIKTCPNKQTNKEQQKWSSGNLLVLYIVYAVASV